MAEKWYTLRQAVDRLDRNVGVRTLKAEIQRGRLRSARVSSRRTVFVSETWIAEWLAASEVKPTREEPQKR